MNKKIILFISIIFLLLSAKLAKAVCPVCTVAVCAGVGLSRWLGIDDVITGIWIGGLLVSAISWTISWLQRKNVIFKGRKILVVVAYYAFAVLPLYYYEIAGHPLNKMWGIDKLILGIAIGTVAFVVGIALNNFLKSKNQGKAYFPFQKVAIPVGMLVVASSAVYFICKDLN